MSAKKAGVAPSTAIVIVPGQSAVWLVRAKKDVRREIALAFEHYFLSTPEAIKHYAMWWDITH